MSRVLGPVFGGRLSKDMHLMPFPGKFPLHHPDYVDNTICVGKECVGEKADFNEDSASNACRILFELIYITVHCCRESLLS
jgi:hypothetical protein